MVAERALDPGRLDEVVHAVEAAQHGGLAAARRADERGDLVLADVEVDVAHGPEVAVVDAEVVDVEDDRVALGVVVPDVADGRRRRWCELGGIGHRRPWRWRRGPRSRGQPLFFSKRLRRMMATVLTTRTITSITTMAAAVSWMKP